MAVAKTKTDLIGTDITKTSIAASSSAESSALDCSSYVGIIIGVEAVFNASATAGVKVEIFSSPVDETSPSWDTIPFVEFEIGVSAGATVQKSIRVGPEVKYLKVKVTNQDGTYAVDVWAFAVGMTV